MAAHGAPHSLLPLSGGIRVRLTRCQLLICGSIQQEVLGPRPRPLFSPQAAQLIELPVNACLYRCCLLCLCLCLCLCLSIVLTLVRAVLLVCTNSCIILCTRAKSHSTLGRGTSGGEERAEREGEGREVLLPGWSVRRVDFDVAKKPLVVEVVRVEQVCTAK